jgi:ABC-type nitrate/sulfonate/bicarbonate transport system substrate-binding protein
VTRRAFTRQNPEAIRAFLKAYVESIRISNEQPEISKRALQRFLATNDAALIDEAYRSFQGIFPKVPYVTEDNIRAVLAVSDHPKAATADPKEFFDNHYLKELEETGFIQQIYSQ